MTQRVPLNPERGAIDEDALVKKQEGRYKMSVIISGATIIDGVSEKPIEGKSIWIENGRIKAVGTRDEFGTSREANVIHATSKFIIPGLMNANVHLLCDIRLEILARYTDKFEELIAEAAQVALKNGLTTVFDTWRTAYGLRSSAPTVIPNQGL